MSKTKKHKVKALLLDIETAPIIAAVWKIWDENIGLSQIQSDWHLLSFAAKWLGDPDSKIIYMDQRNAKNIEDDSKLLKKLWELVNSADVLITQNGVSFDWKKIKARFIMNGFQPPSNPKHIDTLRIAKKNFGFTSNKLEYMTSKLCTKYKKSTHKKFPGFELWKACLAGNKEAYKEMEAYNKMDILSLEELYNKFAPWDSSVNFNLYHDSEDHICNCGHNSFEKRGFYYTQSAKYQKYVCKKCGKWSRGKVNLFSLEKRKGIRPLC